MISWLKQHPLIGTVLSFLIISLPQWLSAVWALFSDEPLARAAARRVRTIGLPSFSAYWITVPLGLLMFSVVLYYLKQRRDYQFDYAYGLALEALSLGRDEDNPSGAAVQLGLVLRNAADGPLRYEVEWIQIAIGGVPPSAANYANRGGVIPRGMRQTFYCAPFDKSVIQPRTKAVVEYSIKYGHPEIGFSRRSKKRLDVSLRLDQESGLIYIIERESDDKI